MKILVKTTQPPSKPPFSEWLRYINHPVLFANTPREGGVGYQEQQKALLEDAKSTIAETSLEDRIRYDRIAYLTLYILIIIIGILVR